MTNQFKRPEEQRGQPSSSEQAEPIVLTEDVAAPSPEKPQAAAQAEDLNAQLAEKDKELTEFRDKYLRVLAESENVRKRVRQQSEESVRIQRENLLRDLLPIVDNLERAVDAARGGGNGKPIVEGVEMVLRSLMDYLRSQGVRPVQAVGQPFDPQHHEAVEHEL
ncbi:MAG: nucleotide exchange factor GrpE, partial [Candidatus Binataceae bacterium]